LQNRESELRRVSVNDIFHASAPNGASLICLAEEVTETRIRARTVTNHFSFVFDRATGVAEWEYEGRPAVSCTIDSVAKLPPEVHALMLEFDRKYGSDEDPRLTVDQKRALLFVWRFDPAHPLPLPWQTMDIGSVTTAEGPHDDELTLEDFQNRLLVVFQIPGPRSEDPAS
jgi:hypothetical protein